MADTVPRMNQNSVNLSLLLDDAVTGADPGIAAAADGAWLTAVKRNYYLHSAYRWLVTTLVDTFGISAASDLIPGFIATQAITFASTGTTLNLDYLFPLRLYKATSLSAFQLSKRASLDDDFMQFVNNFYTVELGKIYGYQRTSGTLAVLPSGSGTLYYLKSDRIIVATGVEVAVNTLPDTTLDLWALDACIYYAAARAAFDKSVIDNDPAWADKGNRFLVAATAMIPKTKTIP